MLNISNEEFARKLRTRIDEANKLLNTNVRNDSELEFFLNLYNNWDRYNSEYFNKVFDDAEKKYKKEYEETKYINFGYIPSIAGKENVIREKFRSKVSVLNNLLYISDLIPSLQITKQTKEMKNDEQIDVTKVFIVHGHDHSILHRVARVVEKLGLEAIILDEQASRGGTIIEKLERNSSVEFAIILLTADDLGKAKSDTDYRKRARQNVILELGYFIAKLGRDKVIPLYEEGVETPSDIDGVVYVSLDKADKWKFELVKELRAAGYNVDANRLV